MSNLYAFMAGSPFLSAFIAYITAEALVRLGVRVLRSINVAVRGWPPAHLDADGDWKPEASHERD